MATIKVTVLIEGIHAYAGIDPDVAKDVYAQLHDALYEGLAPLLGTNKGIALYVRYPDPPPSVHATLSIDLPAPADPEDAEHFAQAVTDITNLLIQDAGMDETVAVAVKYLGE